MIRREKDLKENRKLTGRELFLRDTTLNESDLKFLDDGDCLNFIYYDQNEPFPPLAGERALILALIMTIV